MIHRRLRKISTALPSSLLEFEDWLNSPNYKGGSTHILISPASSKTAFCLAYLIRRRHSLQGSRRRVIGLTSTKNLGFTKRLASYDDVYDYDSFSTSLDVSRERGKWIYVDVAGSDALNSRVRDHLRSHGDTELVARIALGLSNISPSTTGSLSDAGLAKNTPFTGPGSEVAGPELEHFFMPERLAISRRQLSVSTSTITHMQKESWTRFMCGCRTWGVSLRRVRGPNQVKAAYEEIVRKGLASEEAFIRSLEEETSKVKL